ncbi:MAG: ABC transporter ATP-binding protein [Halobacteriales archaeon]
MSDDPPDMAAVFDAEVDAVNPVVHVLVAYGGRYRLVLALALLVAAVPPLLALVPAYLIGVITDAIVSGPSAYALPFVPERLVPATLEGQLVLTLVVLAGTTVLSLAARTADSLLWDWLQHYAVHDLRTDAYDAAQRLGMEFFTTAQTGDVLNVLTEDIDTLEGVFGRWIKRVLTVTLVTVGMAAIMLAMNVELAAVAIALIVPQAVVNLLFNNVVREKYVNAWSEYGQYSARIENAISGIKTIKTNATEEYEHSRVSNVSAVFRDAMLWVIRVRTVFFPTHRLLSGLSTVTIFVVGGWTALFGPPHPFFSPLSVGTFITFFMYSRRFSWQVWGVSSVIDTYNEVLAAGKRVFGLMNHPARIDEADDPITLEAVDGRIAYDAVSFGYPRVDDEALRDVSFDAEPGEFVGIVGPTGAGKTTLVRLLLRLYDPDDGRITLDGHDILHLSLASLRGAIGYVEQKPFLFGGTVAENIGYPDPDAGEEAIVDAARQARAHGFIQELPEGYETEIGEEGVKLSGGQRQRIAIARALLSDPDVLVLDEATSHVDSETERVIQENMDAFRQDRTTLAIAHRLSTVRDADTILVVDDGEIVERGTHAELPSRASATTNADRTH